MEYIFLMHTIRVTNLIIFRHKLNCVQLYYLKINIHFWHLKCKSYGFFFKLKRINLNQSHMITCPVLPGHLSSIHTLIACRRKVRPETAKMCVWRPACPTDRPTDRQRPTNHHRTSSGQNAKTLCHCATARNTHTLTCTHGEKSPVL